MENITVIAVNCISLLLIIIAIICMIKGIINYKKIKSLVDIEYKESKEFFVLDKYKKENGKDRAYGRYVATIDEKYVTFEPLDNKEEYLKTYKGQSVGMYDIYESKSNPERFEVASKNNNEIVEVDEDDRMKYLQSIFCMVASVGIVLAVIILRLIYFSI